MSLDNYTLHEDIREYWSRRADTFDMAFGHKIAQGKEFAAWQKPILDHIGSKPLKVLELACGTGEITHLIHAIGHDVTAVDFSEAMLQKAIDKHKGKKGLKFHLANAESLHEPEHSYDAMICRHLVWTLIYPEETFQSWFRILKPGGKLLIFDGNWVRLRPFIGPVAAGLIYLMDKYYGPDNFYESSLSDAHKDIMSALPFSKGLTYEILEPLLKKAGFRNIQKFSHAPIASAQRRQADLRNKLRTVLYDRFILTAEKPA